MIFALWENISGDIEVPICASPVDNADDPASRVILFPREEKASDVPGLPPDPASGRLVVLSSAFPARLLLSAVVLAQAVKVVDSLSLPSNVLVFSEGLIGEAVRLTLSANAMNKVVVVRVGGEGGGTKGDELDPFAPGFIDSLKTITGGQGFPAVVLASARPELVKKALGCAGVFGQVFFLLPIGGKVSVDLTATVNFKSLILRGRDFFVDLATLTGTDIEAAVLKADSLPVQLRAGMAESGLKIKTGQE